MCSPAFLLGAGLLHSSGSSQQAICESGDVEPLDGTWCLAVVSDKTKSDSEEQGDNSAPSFFLSAGQRRETVPAFSLIGPAEAAMFLIWFHSYSHLRR